MTSSTTMRATGDRPADARTFNLKALVGSGEKIGLLALPWAGFLFNSWLGVLLGAVM